MVDAATKSKRIQDNQKVKDAREHGLLTSKKFEVVLSKANNEPLLTLDLLHQLVGSLASAFTSGSDNVFNPNQSVIKIIDGSRVINKRELKFNLYGLKEDDVKNPKFGEDYVSLTLYPEDVIVIVDYIRRWLVQPQCYKKELGGVSWGISASTLIDSWKTAVKRGKKDPGRKSNYIADFSLKQLKGAVDELFKQINTIYAKKTKEVKYDSIDDLLREIEQKFTEDPAGVWEKIGLVTALGIAEGAIGAQVILISNKNLRVGDARQIINAFYTQVATQLKPQEPQKPWNRILATTKEKFTSTAYLTNNENIITMSDITKVSRFIDLFNQLLKELAIEPKEVEKKIVRDETKQDEGGDTALDEPQLLNNEKIIEKVTRNLIYESGKDFLAFFANKEIDPSQLDPKQRDWLLVGLPSFISSLLEDKYTQGQLTELIQDQISKSLTQLSQEKSDFTVTSNQLADIQKLVNEQFFKQNTGDFFKWIGAVPTAVDIEKSREKIKDKTAQAIVPPGLIDVTTPGYQTPAEIVAGLSTKRKKFYQETAIGLLGLYFSSDQTIAGFTLEDILRLHPELYDFILAFVIKELAGIPTDQLISNLRYQLFQKLVLTHEFQAQIDQLLVTKLTRQPKSFEKILIAMSREPIDKGDATASNIRQAIYHKLTTDVKFYSLVEKLEAIEPVILIKIVGTKAPTPTIPTSATSAEATPAETPAETTSTEATPTELATESSEQREKIYQQTTEELIKIYFRDEKVAGFTPQEIINLHPEFYNFVLDFVAEELAKVPTDQLSFIRPHQLFQKLVLTHEFQAQIDQLLVTKLTRQPKSFEKILIAMSREPIDEGDATASNIRQAIYHKLTTDVKFYSLVENYSKDKLNKIGLGDAKNLNNIYNIIDSLLFLIDDPERFIQGLTADEIREYFNIEEKQVDIEALRTALLSLVALRKFHYLIASGGIKLKPLFRGEKGQQTLKSNPTHIIQVREVIKTADQRGIKEDLIVALNVNEQDIQENTKLSLSQKRLFQLRRQAWVELVTPLNYDQQLALYELYGVFFDIKTLPVPETFIFTELVAQSNLANQYYDLVDRDESLVDQDESLADQDGMTQVAPQFRKAFANQQIRKKIANNAYKALGGAIVKAVPKAAVIEKALKAMGLGKTVDDLEEKLGKAAVIAGAVITAALGGLIALIKQSLWGGLIGGAIGGVAGFVLGAGNPLIFIPSAMVGSAIGSSIGAWISKSGGAGNVFKGLFNQGTAPALQTTLGGSVGGGGLASAIPTSFPIAAIAPTAIITSTALTAVVISQTASSSLRPVMEPDIMTGQQNISQYVEIDKTASISYLENNQPTTVTYSIIITPKNSYVIEMIPSETKDVWSYLGDNPLSLPDQTEKIIEQIGTEPITSPIIISYAVEISGEDIAINNSFTFSFEVLDESGSVTDSVADFASITVGKPDIGCFVPGEAGFSIGSGDDQLNSVAWTPEQWNRLIGLFSYRAGTSINFTKLICQSGELKIYRLPRGEFEDGGGYGGWAFSAGAIGIYDYGLSFTNASLEYTLIHELGHTLDYRNSGLRTDFLTHLHNTSCFTYPFPTRCSSDNEKSGGYEAFAEGTALYVVYQTYNFSGGKYNFKANDSDEYNWFKNNVFEIEF